MKKFVYCFLYILFVCVIAATTYTKSAYATTLACDNVLSPCTLSGLNTIVPIVINIVLVVSGIVFFFLLVLNGFNFITSTGDKKKIESARKGLIYTIVGFFLIFLPFGVIPKIVDIANLTKGLSGKGPQLQANVNSSFAATPLPSYLLNSATVVFPTQQFTGKVNNCGNSPAQCTPHIIQFLDHTITDGKPTDPLYNLDTYTDYLFSQGKLAANTYPIEGKKTGKQNPDGSYITNKGTKNCYFVSFTEAMNGFANYDANRNRTDHLNFPYKTWMMLDYLENNPSNSYYPYAWDGVSVQLDGDPPPYITDDVLAAAANHMSVLAGTHISWSVVHYHIPTKNVKDSDILTEMDEVKKLLANGIPVVLGLDTWCLVSSPGSVCPPGSNGGHVLTLTGYSNGMFDVADPANESIVQSSEAVVKSFTPHDVLALIPNV